MLKSVGAFCKCSKATLDVFHIRVCTFYVFPAQLSVQAYFLFLKAKVMLNVESLC